MTRYLILIILLLSASLRIYHLGYQSYWADEMVSLYFASIESWRGLFLDNHPFLYHLILKPWIMLFGLGEFATRFLSVIFSVATTGVVYFLAKKIIKNNHLALFAAFFHAISSFSIIYAQETRMYALFELAAVVHFYFFYELFFEEKKVNTGFLLSALILAFSHYGAPLVFAFEGFFLLGRRVKYRKIILIGLCIGLLIGLASYLNQFSWFSLEWQKLKYVQESSSHNPFEALVYLSNLSVLNLYFYLILFALSFWHIRKLKAEKKVFFWLAGLIFFSITDVQILTDITKRALMLPRYLIFLNTTWILLFVFCLSQIEKKRAVVWCGVITLIAILWLPKAYFDIKAPWRDAALKIKSESYESKPVVLTTRTLAIQVPYFSKVELEVARLETDINFIQMNFEKTKTIWIIENYWGAKAYLDAFAEELKSAGLKTERLEIQKSLSEPVVLLRITQ